MLVTKVAKMERARSITLKYIVISRYPFEQLLAIRFYDSC